MEIVSLVLDDRVEAWKLSQILGDRGLAWKLFQIFIYDLDDLGK